jgi:hypothetical protein
VANGVTKQLSTRVPGIKTTFRKEAIAYLKDVGRYARDLVRQNAPRKTGELRSSIGVSEVRETAQGFSVKVRSDLPRARWLEKGTGIYGPRKRPIVPIRAKALAWRSKGGGTLLVAQGKRIRRGRLEKYRPRDVHLTFRRSVRGVPPMQFFEKVFWGTEFQAYRKSRLAQMKANIKAAARGTG